MFSPSAITTYASEMIVAFKKPLVWVKKNGRSIAKTISTTATARLHQGGRRRWNASRHSRIWAVNWPAPSPVAGSVDPDARVTPSRSGA